MAERTPRRRAGHTRVFVYGTLRAGQGNHGLLASARFVGVDRTPARFTLFDLGRFPAVACDGTAAIAGEVYDVDADTLARLDRLEGHPRWYQRTSVVLSSHRHAQIYLMPHAALTGRATIASGDWLTHHQDAVERRALLDVRSGSTESFAGCRSSSTPPR